MKRTFLLWLACLLTYAIAPAQPRLQWKFKTGGKIYASPAVANGIVYIGSEDKRVYAVDAQTGKPVWQFATEGAVHSSPAIDNGVVYIGSHDGNFYAIDSRRGQLKWKFRTGGEKVYDTWDYYLSDPRVYRNTVYFGSGDGHVYALDKQTGQLRWKYRTGGVVHATPVIGQDQLYIGSFDGYFYALRCQDGTLVWKFKTVGDAYFPKGEVQKAALLHDSTLYFGSRDYNIYALNARRGTGHWNMKERGSWVIATPFIHQGTIFFGTSDSHTFYALGAESGEVRWKMPLNMRVYGSATSRGDTLLFGSFNGKLYAADCASGKVYWTYQTEGSQRNYPNVYNPDDSFRKDFQVYGPDWQASERKILALGAILSTPFIQGRTVYFGSADGNLYALEMQ